MKRCPSCGALLFRRRASSLEVDGCPGCGGMWLDKGELQALAANPGELRAAAANFVPGAEPVGNPQRSNLCPRCAVPLGPMEYERFRGIRLDRCKTCGGVWLDHGEADAIAARLQPPAGVVDHLARRAEAGTAAPGEPQPHGAPATPGFDVDRVLADREGPVAPADARALRRKVVAGGGLVLLVALALFAVRQRTADVGDNVSRFELRALTSRRTSLLEYAGKVVFIRFFLDSTAGPAGCPNAAAAAASEAALLNEFSPQGAVFLSVSIGEGFPSDVAQDGWTVMRETEQGLYHRFFKKETTCLGMGTSYAFPAYVIIGKDGRVLYRDVGVKPLASLQDLIRKAL